jgi:hypothetical protein
VRSHGNVPLTLERDLKVTIKLPYGDQLPWDVRPSARFQLNVASQVIGKGTVLVLEAQSRAGTWSTGSVRVTHPSVMSALMIVPVGTAASSNSVW